MIISMLLFIFLFDAFLSTFERRFNYNLFYTTSVNVKLHVVSGSCYYVAGLDSSKEENHINQELLQKHLTLLIFRVVVKH